MPGADLTFQEIVNTELETAFPAVRQGAEPPGDGGFPYIQFGQSHEDDDFAPGSSVTIEIHTWSTAEGPHEVKNMQHEIKSRLQKCKHVRGDYQFTAVRQKLSDVFLDEDGETWHGVQRFRALASPI